MIIMGANLHVFPHFTIVFFLHRRTVAAERVREDQNEKKTRVETEKW